ncbi:MAG: hypothetical protein AAF621_02345 [Pseudomonadota bacterium]
MQNTHKPYLKERRKSSTIGKKGQFFYAFATGIFLSVAVTTFVVSCISGFTEERIVLLFLNLWFCLFTMDLITMRFRRKGERAPWHDWATFKKTTTEEEICDVTIEGPVQRAEQEEKPSHKDAA